MSASEGLALASHIMSLHTAELGDLCLFIERKESLIKNDCIKRTALKHSGDMGLLLSQLNSCVKDKSMEKYIQDWRLFVTSGFPMPEGFSRDLEQCARTLRKMREV